MFSSFLCPTFPTPHLHDYGVVGEPDRTGWGRPGVSQRVFGSRQAEEAGVVSWGTVACSTPHSTKKASAPQNPFLGLLLPGNCIAFNSCAFLWSHDLSRVGASGLLLVLNDEP